MFNLSDDGPAAEEQAEVQSYAFGVSVRRQLQARHSTLFRGASGAHFAAGLWKLVRIAEAFMAGLMGRDRPNPDWIPSGQILDLAENGMHWYEAQLLPVEQMSAPPPVFTFGDGGKSKKRKR